MGEMKELLNEATVERAFALLGLLGPLLGFGVGCLYGLVRRVPVSFAAVRGLLLGLLGTLTWGMWRLFSFLVRYQPAPDPKNDYFGLERVDVLLLNIVLFVTVGLLVGLAIRAIRERDRRAQGTVAPPAGEATPVAAGAGDVVQ